MSLAYLDGKFIPTDQVKISPFDYGFARGMTVFEFTRVYGGVAFHLEDHIQRFIHGAKFLGVTVPTTADEIAEAVRHIIAQNKFAHSGIKFYLTLGECGKSGSYGFCGSTDFKPHLMMLEEEFHPVHPEAPKGLPLYQRGVGLKTVPFARQISEVKTINYAPGFVAAQHLVGTDYDEILYHHPDGYVTETTTSNFFCVINGALHTPARNMLLGVTRIVMKDIARALNIPIVEKDISMQDIQHASEAFITGSFLEMMPVRKVDAISFTSTMDAPVFAKMRKAFTGTITDYCKAHRA